MPYFQLIKLNYKYFYCFLIQYPHFCSCKTMINLKFKKSKNLICNLTGNGDTYVSMCLAYWLTSLFCNPLPVLQIPIKNQMQNNDKFKIKQ